MLAVALALGIVSPAVGQDIDPPTAASAGVGEQIIDPDAPLFAPRRPVGADEPIRPGEEIADPDDPRIFDDSQAQRTAAQTARDRLVPRGGLRRLEDDDPAGETQPGDRFRTATQVRADALSEEQLERLRRFSVVDDDALVTGGFASDDAADQGAALRGGFDAEEEDPFSPLGIRRGPLTWFPAIDVLVGYDSNPDEAANARDVRTLRLAPQLRVETDWRRHGFNAELVGSILVYDDDRDVEASFDANADLRLDVGRETVANLRGTYVLDGEDIGDVNAVNTASDRTLTHEIGAEGSIERRFGPIAVTAAGRATRFLFDETDLTGGGTQNNDDRERTDLGASLRLERADGPILRPFVEGAVLLRRFDDSVDRNGFERDSLGYGLRGGLTIADGAPLRGSVSVGLVGETFDDAALDDVTTLDVQAALTWDVTGLTSVTLDLGTELDPTTVSGSGVSITRSAAVGVSHQLRRDLEVRLGASVSEEEISGAGTDETTYTGTAGVTWNLSRVVAFRVDGTYSHQRQSPDDIDRFTIEAGVTLRR